MMRKISRKMRKPGRASRGELTRGRVLSEALVLLDREGLEGLTTRRLAKRLKVSPMALYNHIASKQDLLQGVARGFLNQLRFSTDHPDWRERIRACFRELRGACLEHPGAARLLESMDEPPLSVFRPMEITLAALHEASISREDAVRAYFLLINFVLGQASYEIRGPFKGLAPAEAIGRQHFKEAGLPHIERAVRQDDWDFDAAFEFGLTTILAGLSVIPSQT